MNHLGYPAYFASLLGAWKLLGAIVLTVPGLPRLKEWAYAGFVFDLTAAAFSHAAVGDPPTTSSGPLVFLGSGPRLVGASPGQPQARRRRQRTHPRSKTARARCGHGPLNEVQ